MQATHDLSEAEWWEFVRALPAHEVSIFQTPIWAGLMTEAFADARAGASLFRLADGARVLWPWVRRRRLGLWDSVESMPFGTYGGFVCEREPARAELWALLAAVKRQARGAWRLLVTPNPLGRWPVPHDVFPQQNSVHFLNLAEGYDRIWKSRFSRGLRYSVRKALRRGVVAERATSAADFRQFARLYAQTAERWDKRPPFDERFFEGLAGLDGERVQLWVARVEGEMASGVVMFVYGEHLTPYVGGFDRRFTGYDPNNLMYAEAMKWAAREGLGTFNFLSSAGVRGVEHFKSSFGTERVYFNYYVDSHPLLRFKRLIGKRR